LGRFARLVLRRAPDPAAGWPRYPERAHPACAAVAYRRWRFPTIETPTLVIWGDADVALDFSCIENVADYSVDVTLHRLPGVSHWVPEEVPEQVNALIGDFLSQRVGTGVGPR
jgi:pimeloyl-ACP methyl ester carboxylesterase